MKNLKILIISHRFYPATNARAYRWTSLASYLASQGHSIDVIAFRQQGTPKHELYNGINIVRTLDIFKTIKESILGEKNKKEALKSLEASTGNKKKIVLLKFMLYLQKNIWDKLCWPDRETMWILPTYYTARKMVNRKKYDAILTVARPFSSHLVGLFLKKRLEHTVWICDIGDPFSFDVQQMPNNLFLYARLNKWIEKKVFLKSQGICVTTEETANEYIKELNLRKDIFHVIPPLFSLEKKIPRIQAKKRGHEEINLAFFGSLYANIRNPLFLIRLIEKVREQHPLKKFNLHFYGNAYDCLELLNSYDVLAVNRWIYMHGMVERVDIPQLMEMTDVLVNIGNFTSYQLPSKIIEYVYSGKPILNIARIKYDSSSRFLEHYPSCLTILEEDQIDNAIIDKVVSFLLKAKPVNAGAINNILRNHTLPEISKKYISLIIQQKSAFAVI